MRPNAWRSGFSFAPRSRPSHQATPVHHRPPARFGIREVRAEPRLNLRPDLAGYWRWLASTVYVSSIRRYGICALALGVLVIVNAVTGAAAV